MDFETRLKKLETLVDKMSQENINLTEAIKTFKEGMDLVKECQKDLHQAEQTVEKLIQVHSDGKTETEPFESCDEN